MSCNRFMIRTFTDHETQISSKNSSTETQQRNRIVSRSSSARNPVRACFEISLLSVKPLHRMSPLDQRVMWLREPVRCQLVQTLVLQMYLAHSDLNQDW